MDGRPRRANVWTESGVQAVLLSRTLEGVVGAGLVGMAMMNVGQVFMGVTET